MEKARFDVFLSHATPDKPAVEELARLLKKRGFEPWLDKWNLIPGEPWQEAIEKALEDCAACAVCLGPSGTGPWQNEEMRAAIDRRVSGGQGRFRVIPVLLPRAERGEPSRLPAFLRATTWVEFRETLDDEKALHRLDCGIRGVPPGSDPGEAVAEGACPYRGLQVFDVGDALFFFGREALTGWLLDKLRTDRTGNRFLAIVGPSGSGKSSLARAGLIANLKRGEIPGSDTWPVAICKPGAQPLESLAVALAGAARLGDSPSAVRELIRDLGTDSRMLHLTTRLSLRDAPADRRLIVLVDQFEEVFTLCPDEAQRQAILANLLHAATAADGQTVVVVTLRADFYGRCAAYPDLAAAISDRQSLVGPMTRDELRSAVERPAYLTGCELEGGLADLLLNEVEAEPGSLPLLEHALLQIWQRREGGRRLTIAAYHEIGGVAGALEKHAEEVYSGLTEGEKETCRRVFLRLVQVDEQGRATKRRLSLDDLAPASEVDGRIMETVIGRLTNARLLTTDQEKRPTVELAHEALLANWGRFKQWIEQDREALRTRRRLDEAVAEWLGKNRDPSFLLEGGRLAQIEEWAERHPGEAGPEARELLAASVTERDQERQRELVQAKALEEEQRRRADSEHQRAEEQTRARRRLRKWAVAFAATTAAALVAAAIIFHLRQVSEEQRRISLADELAVRSKTLFNKNPIVATLLSIRAAELAKAGGQPHLTSAEEALRDALALLAGSQLPTGKVQAAALSYDQQFLVTAGTDSEISLWNLTDSSLAETVPISEVADRSLKIRLVAVSPGGNWALIADSKGDSQLLHFDRRTKGKVKFFPLPGQDWLEGNDPFSPDGQWLLIRGRKRSWTLRNLTRSPSTTTTVLNISPESMAFSSDGHWLATAEKDTLRIWELFKNRDPRAIEVPRYLHTSKVEAIYFSPDAQWLIVVGGQRFQRYAQAWKLGPVGISELPVRLDICAQDPFLRPAFLNTDHIPASIAECWARDRSLVSEDPDPPKTTASAINLRDNWLAVGTADGELRVHTGGPLDTQSFRIQSGPIHLIAFHGHQLLIQGGQDAPRVLVVHEERLGVEAGPYAVAPNGLLLMRNPEARLLNSQGVHPVIGSSNAYFVWVFSPDGGWLAANGSDGRPLVWHINGDGTTSPPLSFPVRYHHSHFIATLAFSPDGRWLCSGDQDGESRLWDIHNPRTEPWPLTNHIGAVTALAFRSDSRVIATAGKDGVVRLRQLTPNPAPKDLPSSPGVRGGPVAALAFLPDGRLAISGRNQLLTLWAPSRQEVMLDSNEFWEISELLVSPRGDRIAGRGAVDGTVQIWTSNGSDLWPKPVQLRRPDTNGPLAFTPDGNGLWSLDFHGKLHRVELRTEKLIEAGCRTAGRNLTENEWRAYIPYEPYQEREPCPEFPKAYD